MLAKIFPKLIIAAALLAPLWFPWPLAALLMLAAGAFEPLAAPACGLLADALYFSRGVYPLPFMTLLGTAIALASYFVRKFVETRIIG
jgi:hypothetical protein